MESKSRKIKGFYMKKVDLNVKEIKFLGGKFVAAVECKDLDHYISMPNVIKVHDLILNKTRYNPEAQSDAYFHSNYIDVYDMEVEYEDMKSKPMIIKVHQNPYSIEKVPINLAAFS